MKSFLQKIGGLNWSTNLPAAGAAICGSAELIGLLPPEYAAKAMSACTLALALGLFAAKSKNVTNAETPGAAKPVQ